MTPQAWKTIEKIQKEFDKGCPPTGMRLDLRSSVMLAETFKLMAEELKSLRDGDAFHWVKWRKESRS